MYGIIISFGILISSLLGEKIIKAKNLDLNNYWGAVFWTVIFGVIGARLYHVMDYWEVYGKNTELIWQIYTGGLGIYGAVFGGLFGAFVYLTIKRESISTWLDVFAIVTPLGQAVGRWGNYVNQELYGKATSLPWAIFIKLENDYFHPLFLYESLLSLILFLILWKAFKKNSLVFGKGLFLAAYLLGYGLIRFWLEFLRIDPWVIGGLNIAQAISVLLIGVCVLVLMKKSSILTS